MDSTINERLRKFVEMEQITFAVFRKVVHAPSAQQVSNWMTSRDNVPDKYIKETIIKYPKINARWLLTGEGEMYNETENHHTDIEFHKVSKKMHQLKADAAEVYEVINELETSIDVLRKTVKMLRTSLDQTSGIFKQLSKEQE